MSREDRERIRQARDRHARLTLKRTLGPNWRALVERHDGMGERYANARERAT